MSPQRRRNSCPALQTMPAWHQTICQLRASKHHLALGAEGSLTCSFSEGVSAVGQAGCNACSDGFEPIDGDISICVECLADEWSQGAACRKVRPCLRTRTHLYLVEVQLIAAARLPSCGGAAVYFGCSNCSVRFFFSPSLLSGWD